MSRSEPATNFAWRDVAAIVLTLSGLVLLALSFVWPRASSGRHGWTEQKALAYQDAAAEVHRLSMQDAGMKPEQRTRAFHEELAAAQSRYLELRAELDTARGGPTRIAMMLRYAGILLLIAGVVGLLIKRGSLHAS